MFVTEVIRQGDESVRIAFQSPIKRGNVCDAVAIAVVVIIVMFQSPIKRGNVCDEGLGLSNQQSEVSFNPLSSGAMFVTR